MAYDYALIKLSEKVEGADDFMPLSSNTEKLTWACKLSIYGYTELRKIMDQKDKLKIKQVGMTDTHRLIGKDI